MENEKKPSLQEQIAAKKAEVEAKKDAASDGETKDKVVSPADKAELAEIQKIEDAKKAEDAKKTKKQKVVIFNTSGAEMKLSDYFHKGVVPAGFEGTCGKPVDREDLLTVFNKVFKPTDNILFYKQIDKEVYLVIVPLKYSTAVGDSEDSLEGDFQKHAISFLNEGSVNIDTLRQKLERIVPFVNYSDR